MDLQLDHIVHFINGNPKLAVEKWGNFDFCPVMGGSHEKWGTYNSLLYTSNSYIEFLAIENECLAQNSDNPLISQLVTDLQFGEGIGQICFRTTNILQVKKELEKKGCRTFPIFPGSRKRKDGSTIKWKMLFINQSSTFPFPFFIEWEQKDEVRFRELKELGMIDEKLENHFVQSIHIACRNSEQHAYEWANLFDFPIKNTKNETYNKTILTCGATEIIFCNPLDRQENVNHSLPLHDGRPFLVQFEPRLFNEPISLMGSLYQ